MSKKSHQSKPIMDNTVLELFKPLHSHQGAEKSKAYKNLSAYLTANDYDMMTTTQTIVIGCKLSIVKMDELLSRTKCTEAQKSRWLDAESFNGEVRGEVLRTGLEVVWDALQEAYYPKDMVTFSNLIWEALETKTPRSPTERVISLDDDPVSQLEFKLVSLSGETLFGMNSFSAGSTEDRSTWRNVTGLGSTGIPELVSKILNKTITFEDIDNVNLPIEGRLKKAYETVKNDPNASWMLVNGDEGFSWCQGFSNEYPYDST